MLTAEKISLYGDGRTIELTRRPMDRRLRTALERAFCREQESYLWAQRRIVKPVLLPVVYGDGRQIVAVRPINTRLSHYVVAVDSSITLPHGTMHDLIDHIYEDLEDEFGMCIHCIDEDEEIDPFAEWPAPCIEGGSEWWLLANRRK